MTLQWLLNWWNLIFLLPFALALLYLGLYTASGITFGDVDSDADFDADADIDHDLDADHGVDADHDVDADQDADADHDTDADQDADAGDSSHISPHLAVMSWLGIGKVPVSIVLMVCLLTWGVTGFLVNASLPDRGGHAALLSIPIAALCALLMTHTVVVLISRYLPLYETTAPRRHALLGSVGEVMLPVDQRFGMVSVRDGSGDLYQVPCRLDSSAGAVSKGRKVKLIAYNAKQGLFYVESCEPAEEKALS